MISPKGEIDRSADYSTTLEEEEIGGYDTILNRLKTFPDQRFAVVQK